MAQIQQVQSQRQTELTDAQNLDTADLQNGGAIKSELVVALQDSLAADGAYLSWSESQADPSTCVEWRSTIERRRRRPAGHR